MNLMLPPWFRKWLEPSLPRIRHVPNKEDLAEEVEAQRILSQLEAAMPTNDRGQAWLEQARTSLTPGETFMEEYHDALLALAPELRRGATRPWCDLLESHDLLTETPDIRRPMALLAALLYWQIAAAARALHRNACEVHDLEVRLWSAVEEETRRYLLEQEVVPEGLDDLPQQGSVAAMLYPLALRSPEPEATADPTIELVLATAGMITDDTDEGLITALAHAWMIMDSATIGVLYRSFGNQQSTASETP